MSTSYSGEERGVRRRAKDRQERRKAKSERRVSERTPGLLRTIGAVGADARPTIDHGIRRNVGMSWRMLSGVIILVFAVVLAIFFTAEVFYVRSVIVVGTNYLEEGEVFRYADIAEMHVFWIDPETVRQNIIQSSPVIADVEVVVNWPPNMVRIYVEEREPVLIWTQSGVSALVDLQGRVLRYPPENEARPDLIQIIADNTMEGPPGVDSPIPIEAVHGALQLENIFAGVRVLRYNPAKGLGFREPSGWDVWLGTGTNMPDKLQIYDALQANLINRGITPVEINVSNPDAVYYCADLAGCF